jgi:CheY-like chemotaxis protein
MNILGDETRLRQVLINLVSNAIKFTDEGFVKIKLTQTALSDDHMTVKFEVSDSGIGINQEQQSRIFESFEQANMNTTKKYGGTGLGLNICQNILLLMGSSLAVSSEPMVGSTFCFELNFKKADSENLHLSNSTTQYVNEHLLKQQNILFYSENAIGKDIFDHICDNFKWQCLHASSTDQVLTILDESISNEDHPTINVVVVDKYEINDSTWDELRLIKQQITSDDGPLIYLMCTLSSDLSSELEDYQQVLIDGYFIKPITPSNFYEEIASQLLDKYDNQPAAGHIQYDFSQLHILLVEDNFINQEVARNMLENLHINVSIVEDGQQAIETLTEQPHEFDIIFMDMQMPVMDGITATRYIRHTLNLTDVPIIAMTANAMVSDQKTCRDAGMNDHLAKPFDLDMLTEIIIANLPNA